MDPDTTADTTTEHDDFNAGFLDDPTPTAAPGPDEASTPAEPAAPEYAQLTKQELEELKARAALIDQIQQTQEKSFGTAFGKLGGIERDLKALKEGKKVEIDQADIDALQEDFPGLAKALEKVRDLQVIQTGGTVDAEAVDKLVQERMKPLLDDIPGKVEQVVETRLLKRMHPDWETYQVSDEFRNWAKAQPAEYVQRLATTWDADFIGDAMTKAKEAAKAAKKVDTPTEDPASTRRSRMSAAVTPRGTGGTSAPSDDDAFNEGFRTG